MAYTCQSCGAVAHEPVRLCIPAEGKRNAVFADLQMQTRKHMCKDKPAAMNLFAADAAGMTMEKEHLCIRPGSTDPIKGIDLK